MRRTHYTDMHRTRATNQLAVTLCTTAAPGQEAAPRVCSSSPALHCCGIPLIRHCRYFLPHSARCELGVSAVSVNHVCRHRCSVAAAAAASAAVRFSSAVECGREFPPLVWITIPYFYANVCCVPGAKAARVSGVGRVSRVEFPTLPFGRQFLGLGWSGHPRRDYRRER